MYLFLWLWCDDLLLMLIQSTNMFLYFCYLSSHIIFLKNHHDLTNYMTFWWSDDDDDQDNIMHMQCKLCVCVSKAVYSWLLLGFRVLCSFLFFSFTWLAFFWLDLTYWYGWYLFCSFFPQDEPVCFLSVYYGDRDDHMQRER